MPSKRFPYGQPTDWTLSTAERNWWFVPVVALGAWRAWAEGHAWSIPLVLVGGYLLGVAVHHRSRFGERGRLEEWTDRAHRRPVLYLFVIPIGLLIAFVIVLTIVIAIFEVATG